MILRNNKKIEEKKGKNKKKVNKDDDDDIYDIDNESDTDDSDIEEKDNKKDKEDDSEEKDNKKDNEDDSEDTENNICEECPYVIENTDYDMTEEEKNMIKSNIILLLGNKRDYESESDSEENLVSKKKKSKYHKILSKYSREERKYFNDLEETEKDKIFELENKFIKNNEKKIIPSRFKILNYDISNILKQILIYNIEALNNMCKSSSEYHKLNNWITTLSRIPIGKYKNLDIEDGSAKMYLEKIKTNIDNNIFGHDETKEQIIRILAQWISNPNKSGYVIGIKGPPGVGKTKLVKECICSAIDFPLAFISLGGIDDASYLTGFNYTYEGSKYGKILDCLIKAEVMNPVFLFDELDKVSATSRGDEIINTLIHLTDPVQNDKYTDKYFQEIDLDLSKSIIIFTYNNEDYINPILKDRMITINVKGYTNKEKFKIAKDYLIDEIIPKYNIKKGDIIFEDELIEYIVELTSPNENGVRTLKREINNIISWVNMMRYIKTDSNEIVFPYKVTKDYYNKYCKKNESIDTTKVMSMYL